MTELSPRARSLLAQAKVASTPSPEDAAAVLAGLSALAPTAGTSAATSVAFAKGSTLATLKLSLTFALAVGAGVVTTSVVIRRLRPAPAPRAVSAPAARNVISPSPGTAPDVAEPNVAATAPDPTPGVVAAGGVTPPLKPDVVAARGTTPRGVAPGLVTAPSVVAPTGGVPGTTLDVVAARGGAPGATASDVVAPRVVTSPGVIKAPAGREVGPAASSTPDPRCALNSELASVRRAQALLTTAPQQSMLVLEAWERECSTGALIQERLALRALALCAQSELATGQATLLELRTRFPSSPSLQRVERACTSP